jgi:hypothetical protein
MMVNRVANREEKWNQSVRGGTEGTDVATEQETSISQLMTVGEAGGNTEVAFETKLIPLNKKKGKLRLLYPVLTNPFNHKLSNPSVA